MVDVKLPVVWKMGVFIWVNCSPVVTHPNIVTLSCKDVRKCFFSKVT
jgi:hypothetical protein